MVAGAFNNIVFAFIIMLVIYMVAGSASNGIGSIEPDSPAASSGLQVGDIVEEVGTVKTDSWQEVVSEIGKYAADHDGQVVLTVKRSGKLYEINTSTYEKDGRQIIGIRTLVTHSPWVSAKYTYQTFAEFMNEFKMFFVRLFTGNAKSEDVVGVVGIVSVIGEATRTSFVDVVFLMCVLSLNLGIVNLLPFPALDGGRILFVLIRAVFKNISEETEGKIHAAGMMILLALMLFLIFKDTINLFR